ncbi:hypothetical protein DITRI_Ditri19aG0130600 [Diplodiscus trichospermus]
MIHLGKINRFYLFKKFLKRLSPSPFYCVRSFVYPNLLETDANVLTSLPFTAIGIQAPRGKLRRYLRWANYKMIATFTVCL